MRFVIRFLILGVLFYSGLAFATCDASDPNCPQAADCAMTIDQVRNKLNAEYSQCERYQNKAGDCCLSGTNCSGGGGASMDGDIGSMMKMVSQIGAASMLAQASPDDMGRYASMCNMMNQSGGINGGIANSCADMKETCMDSCGGSSEYFTNLEVCLTDPAAKKYVKDNFGDFSLKEKVCKKYNPSTAQQQRVSQNNMGSSNFCNQLRQQQDSQMQLSSVAPPGPDCSQPYMATTQVCQVCNGDPSSPACQKAIQDSGGAQPASFQKAAGNTGAVSNLGEGSTDKQQAQFASNNNPAAPASADTPYGRGGGAPMAALPQQANAAQGPQGRGGYGPGYDPKNTLQGERGGGGASSGGTGSEPEGSFQYASGTDRGLAGVDLKNYLPGRRFYAGHKLAGVGSANPDINARTTDLFKRISDRMQVICSLNRLMDCTPNQIPKGL